MALRLVEMVCPASRGGEVAELVKEHRPIGIWHDAMANDQVTVRILLPAEEAESVLDLLESQYSMVEGFRILLLPVEASIPRPEPHEEKAEEEGAAPEQEPKPPPSRISREELYSDIEDSARLTRAFLAMIALSSVVAAIGLLRDNVAVIIGAMVIAPLLGPHMALSFAATLGDASLGRQALRSSAAGIVTAFGIACMIGVALPVDLSVGELSIRTRVALGDVVLALASGSAGALAFTSGIPTALVGVMVAVALLPPLVVLGLLVGSGQLAAAFGALLLFTTNLICVNLAGVATFLLHGIRPRTWWESHKAKRSSRVAMLLWILLLLLLALAIVLSQSPD